MQLNGANMIKVSRSFSKGMSDQLMNAHVDARCTKYLLLSAKSKFHDDTLALQNVTASYTSLWTLN